MKRFIVVLFLITAAVCSEAADRVILADNSKTDYKIVFHGTPNKEEKAAVADLYTFLNLISGADFKIKCLTCGKIILIDSETLSKRIKYVQAK